MGYLKLLTFSYLLFVTVAIVRSTSVDPFSESPEGHLALVSVNGLIAAEADANANAVLGSFKAAVEHPGTRAVMLSINSGGGSPVQSDRIWRGIQRIRSEHPDLPIVASIADIGASGAYYIATAAEHIYADEASLVGSIGVISAGFGFEELPKNWALSAGSLPQVKINHCWILSSLWTQSKWRIGKPC